MILISAGPTSSRIHTVSLRSLAIGASLAMLLLLAAGAGIGHWAAQAAAVPQATAPQRATPALPFAVEQLGALSARLFRLESQAGQLRERFGATPAPAAAAKPVPSAQAQPTPAGSGGPLLSARPELDAVGDLARLQARLDEVEQQLGDVDTAAALQRIALMRLPTRLPVDRAALTSTFGNRDDPFTGRRAFHAGQDFAAVAGAEIHAAAGGTVAFAGFRPDYGWTVEIAHGNRLTTRYAHASRLLVKAGAVVMPGEAIANVGSTGRSTGPHLHFEVLRDGEAVDPRRYLAGV